MAISPLLAVGLSWYSTARAGFVNGKWLFWKRTQNRVGFDDACLSALFALMLSQLTLALFWVLVSLKGKKSGEVSQTETSLHSIYFLVGGNGKI